ncbi:MAG: hypothetical protein OEU92_35260 [Alphaproteobacteria bacterium]|nr:hypothetical protein [Alphaproteobacteria bacterium]
MSLLLKNADPAARNALVTRLARAGAGESRIAIGAVLGILQKSFGLRVEGLGRIKIVDKPFVEGLKNMEPLLIDAPVTGIPPRSGRLGGPAFDLGGIAAGDLAVRRGVFDRGFDFNATDLSAVLGATTRTPQQKRLGLLSASSALSTLATFGRDANAAERAEGAKMIVAVLDSPNASAASVKAVIIKVAKESR